jgi:hypothetical protein
MLKIKIPPRSEPEKTKTVPLKQGTEDNAVTQFRDWWQEEFEEPADFLEYDAGQLQNAVALSKMIENFVWPDFKVGAEGSWVVFRRVEERYFPRKSKDESSQLNDERRKQEKFPENKSCDAL